MKGYKLLRDRADGAAVSPWAPFPLQYTLGKTTTPRHPTDTALCVFRSSETALYYAGIGMRVFEVEFTPAEGGFYGAGQNPYLQQSPPSNFGAVSMPLSQLLPNTVLASDVTPIRDITCDSPLGLAKSQPLTDQVPL